MPPRSSRRLPTHAAWKRLRALHPQAMTTNATTQASLPILQSKEPEPEVFYRTYLSVNVQVCMKYAGCLQRSNQKMRALNQRASVPRGYKESPCHRRINIALARSSKPFASAHVSIPSPSVVSSYLFGRSSEESNFEPRSSLTRNSCQGYFN